MSPLFEAMVKRDLQRLLRDFDKSLTDFGIDPVPEEIIPGQLIANELNRYNQAESAHCWKGCLA